jgi:hypothetical protein
VGGGGEAGFHGLVQQLHGAVGVLLLFVRALAAGNGVDAGKFVPGHGGPERLPAQFGDLGHPSATCPLASVRTSLPLSSYSVL